MASYLKVYSQLTPQELRQLKAKEKYKKLNPSWDDSLIWLCRIFQSHLVPNMKVLDAGCGHGNYVIDEYRSKISRAVGIDIDPKATKKNVCLDKVVIGDLADLPFKDEYFDAVLSLWVIEHLKDPKSVFEQAYRVLKKGGVFIFVTPNKTNYLILLGRFFSVFPNLASKLIKKVYGREEKDVFGTFYRANTKKDLEKMLTAVGFKKSKLFYNGDPSYLAFNNFLFKFGIFLDRLPQISSLALAKPHIIGEFLK
jgi:ubiquinone/menaquinone biosynthesis C-methylase UbiE